MNVKKIKNLILIIITLTFISGCSNSEKQMRSTNKLDRSKDIAIQYNKWRGVPYQFGGNSFSGIDCSAFTQITFNELYNVSLPRTTAQQAKSGVKIAYENKKPGDLIFFKTGIKQRHVGIYAGKNQFLHASTSKGVILSRLDNPYWQSVFCQVRRVG
ncbi:NlpC/P60 family protein [Vibrio sp. SS-MA-C1-2]|uniref:C40 family peptidase n=1 Tax=Vibrio sp. SS-MA-C1-2 TaxID=2908646 RepID=UPI001F29D3DF|nr:NlpC/P60 family protein [Vibrio sp. SS-MA-C1-2]UJF18318.1 NlpC/P60 family protein [Vibrio sp. SS-MA-C1-2]